MSSPITSSSFENQTTGQALCDAFQEKLLNNKKMQQLLDYLFVDPSGEFSSTFIVDLMSFLAPVGCYKAFPVDLAGDVANPTNGIVYLEANGQLLSQASYTRLFSYLGTTFNHDDDPDDKFRVPDLSGKFHLSRSGSHAVESTGGSETHQLTLEEIPGHAHKMFSDQEAPNGDVQPTSNDNVTVISGDNIGDNRAYSMQKTDPDLEPTLAKTGISGGNGEDGDPATAHSNMPPYLTGITYIVAGYKVSGAMV